MQRFVILAILSILLAATAQATDSSVPAYPGPNRGDEPIRKDF